jgi:hypothetical protein
MVNFARACPKLRSDNSRSLTRVRCLDSGSPQGTLTYTLAATVYDAHFGASTPDDARRLILK